MGFCNGLCCGVHCFVSCPVLQSSWGGGSWLHCLLDVMLLYFSMLLWVGLQLVIVLFPDHTHLLYGHGKYSITARPGHM